MEKKAIKIELNDSGNRKIMFIHKDSKIKDVIEQYYKEKNIDKN